ncbi:MAG: glycerophosphodiester phosphodiesterase family protein [Gemmatimonadota bacterium]|nr:glycerophosphodiester phosphodiesterase family protein [Gemmatimonadota bacterium]
MKDPFALPGRAEIIAHRGYSARAPENTVVALEAGLDAGADAVEFDLHTAGDGTPVLMHDASLRRTTNGRGRVTRRSIEQLATLDAGSWFAEEFAGEPVPTLGAALKSVGGRAHRIYAELKGWRDIDDLAAVVAEVAQHDLLEATVFISMSWDGLTRVRVAEPAARIGYIVDKRSRADEALERASGDALALLDFDARILLSEPELAERAHAAEVALATWTVDTVGDARTLLSMGVPRITTNQVATLVRWRDALD